MFNSTIVFRCNVSFSMHHSVLFVGHNLVLHGELYSLAIDLITGSNDVDTVAVAVA